MPSYFAMVRPSGAPVSEPARATDWSWHMAPDQSAIFGHIAVDERVTFAHDDNWMIVGAARLDNREDLLRWSRADAKTSDLHLIAVFIAQRGVKGVRDILGDFAFVFRDLTTQQTIAARDAFGVKALFHRLSDDELAFSSRATALARGNDYDLEYIAEFLLNGFDLEYRTPWRGVRALAPGHVLVSKHGRTTITPYWSASEFQPESHAPVEESCEQFRELLERAVISNLSGRPDVWSQLSGGLDSSSVVSMAETLRCSGRIPFGVAGVVTLIDSLDDEGPYARAVVDHYGLRHEVVQDYWLWQDDGEPPPANDLPDPLYPFYARNRRLTHLVQSAGGNVLLSGVGPDHYLSGNLYFFADLLARGRGFTALRELVRWSVLTKKSFWPFAFTNAVAPLLPPAMKRFAAPRWAQVQDWIAPEFVRRFNLQNRTNWSKARRVQPGHAYADHIQANMAHVPACVDQSVFENLVEMRYPYLYRPLVEFGLRLPRESRTQPGAFKWIMRETLKGVLPERVRTRQRKNAISGRTRWSLRRAQVIVEDLTRRSILADLGCVDVLALRRAVEQSVQGDDTILFAVVRTLALETWLRVVAGRWGESGVPAVPHSLELVPAM